MLTAEIKQKIDNARNILVGKIPTPTGQVEQITLALVYKFMNDIDEEQIELGGRSKFFNREYQQYAWKRILDRSLSAYQRVTLYGEGLEKMNLNPNLPQFFRNVFKGAFLPFRDPEVLNIFLKQIDEFKYGHNGDLGDAFEYLLQVMGTQGDAGQFLTPRHIINFIVNVVEPNINDRILDPACGTGGFLISAYKLIEKHKLGGASDTKAGKLTLPERRKLANNFFGYDISYDLVRLSLVNLYLHEFPDPKIMEYDTLTSLEKWDEDFECIMTNPPFMTPKGGIRPHKRFSIQANRSEILFVDYVMEHLTPNGKAGIIVPEGIIFQSANAYKSLRKKLVEQNYIYAVASLPGGIFNPYSGVKTSILFMDRVLAKKTDKILFVKIENDGYELGAQRKLIDKNDLPTAEGILKKWKSSIQTSSPFALNRDQKRSFILTSKKDMCQNGNYDLTGDRYREAKKVSSRWPMEKLGEVCALIGGGTPSKSKKEYWENGSIKWISAKHFSEEKKIDSFELISQRAVDESSTNLLPKNSIIIVSRVSVGKIAIADDKVAINQDLTGIVPKDKGSLNYKYLFYTLCGICNKIAEDAQGLGVKGVTRDYLRNIRIPVPPIQEQNQIVDMIEKEKEIVGNHKTQVKVHEAKIEEMVSGIWSSD